MAIAMAQNGGIGVLHRNMTIGRTSRRSGAKSRNLKAAWWS